MDEDVKNVSIYHEKFYQFFFQLLRLQNKKTGEWKMKRSFSRINKGKAISLAAFVYDFL